MTRIRWENLPSTSTPLIDTNLNKANNVVISSTEPNTGEEVWLQKGKNLFNGILRNVAISSTTGEETSSTTIKSSEYINVNSSTNYTMSTNETEHKYYYYFYNNNKQFINGAASGYDVTSHTFTTPQNCGYMRFSLSSPTSSQIQLEKGSTATTYEEFKPHKIYENKDGFYDLFTETVSVGNTVGNGRVNFIKGKNLYTGQIEKNGYLLSSDGSEVSDSRGFISSYINVLPNTAYTISYSSTDLSFGIRIGEYTGGMSFIQRTMTTNATYTFTTTATTKYIKLSGGINYVSNIQLEKSSTATSFEPYVTPAIVVDGEEIYSKEKILFIGKSNTNITLNDNINNYKYIEITYTNSNENMWGNIKIPVTATTRTVLQRMNVSNTSEKQITQFFFKVVELSGTSLTVSQNRALFMESSLTDYSTISGTSSSDNTIYITKIVGYK